MVDKCRELQDEVSREIELARKFLDNIRVPKIAIVGPPNAGKSTLMNYITAEDLSIISPWEGTTRDTIKGEVTVAGNKLQIIDTAGIRQTKEPIEKIGIERSM